MLAFRIVAACRTTADLREMWPDGERFWGPMAERLELEAGTSTCVGLVPVSQVERLNDVSRKLREV